MSDYNTIRLTAIALLGGAVLPSHGQSLTGPERPMQTTPNLSIPTDGTTPYVQDMAGGMQLELQEATDETGLGVEESIFALPVARELLFRHRMDFRLDDMEWVQPSISFDGPSGG